MTGHWAVTIYNTSTGEIVDYATFETETMAIHYARLRVWGEEKYLGFMIKRIG